MKSTELLKNEHQQISRALKVLEAMALRIEQERDLPIRDLEGTLSFLNGFLNQHQDKEETAFFPALLRDTSQKNYPQLSAAVFEHNRERSLLEGLEDSIRTGNIKEFHYYSMHLTETLREHIHKEEQVLFALADSALTENDDQQVTLELSNFGRAWQQKTLPRLLERLDQLEAKFVVAPDGDGTPITSTTMAAAATMTNSPTNRK